MLSGPPAHRADADAIVVSQAMFATTIAEFFVEDETVRLELEIGMADLAAFADLLPDDIYEKLGKAPLPLAERLERFFTRGLVIMADDGMPLPGRLVEIGPGKRVARDSITGEPIAGAEDEAQDIVAAQLEYRFPDSTRTLTIKGLHGPRPTSIGFVVYHHDVAVNDFRYLTPSQTLVLDAEDPWYSHFNTRALRRRYYAPMNGFLYVEPYEVRKEIIVRPVDLQSWLDLKLSGHKTIPVEMQAEVKRKVGEFLRGHHAVQIDGKTVEGELARINFLERSLKASRVVDPPEELSIYSAMLGVIFVYPTDGLPNVVTMDWDLWNERMDTIPAVSVDQAGPLPTTLDSDYRVLKWQNFLKNPQLPTLITLVDPPTMLERVLLAIRWIVAGIAGLCLLLIARSFRTQRPSMVGAFISVALVIGFTGGVFRLADGAAVSDERAGEVVSPLLHNIYRAFDYRDEEKIYDTLALSVAGDLLTDVYLETRRGLELASQGGARVKVKEVELIDVSAKPAGGGGFAVRTTWRAAGSVGHWGHIHQRANRYMADLTINPVEGRWKLTGLEILEEEQI
jgi:hypothetical protein